MPAQFLGLKLLGDNASKAIATWSIAVNTNDTQPAGGKPLQIQGQVAYNAAFNKSFPYLLDIKSVQGTYTFGAIKRLGFTLTHSRAYEDGNIDFYIPGRVFINIPSTGQLFVYCSRDCMVFGDAAFAVTPEKVQESFNEMLPVDLPPETQIEIWIESDFETGSIIIVPDATLRLSAYNF